MGAEFIEARWWQKQEDGRTACWLCPRLCKLREDQSGFCRVRRNEGGRLLSLSYGHPTGFATDPIEKKPLFHFLPGSLALSFGTLGCTLGCRFCQNWTHSHAEVIEAAARMIQPAEVVTLAEGERAASISYTYNEPTVFAEYVVDISRLARARGIRNVMVTNGYVTPQARNELYEHIDGANVDLKGFSDEFYREQAQGRLEPVLDTLEWIKNETDVWLEITTLLIPDLNDSEEMISRECDWIVDKLGCDVPVHFTAFHPDYKMLDRARTPAATLVRARDIAMNKGIRYVYVGNVPDPDGQSTLCPQCGEMLIARSWHSSRIAGLAGSCCRKCGTTIAGVFETDAVPGEGADEAAGE